MLHWSTLGLLKLIQLFAVVLCIVLMIKCVLCNDFHMLEFISEIIRISAPEMILFSTCERLEGLTNSRCMIFLFKVGRMMSL